MTATLIVSAVWCAWHLPVLLSGVATAVTFAVTTLALGFLLAAVWARTRRSTLAAAVGHAAVNAPMFFFEGALGADAARAAWYAAGALYAALAGALVLVGWRWWRAEPAAPGHLRAAASSRRRVSRRRPAADRRRAPPRDGGEARAGRPAAAVRRRGRAARELALGAPARRT
jgi:hypothetical protein